MSTFQKEIKFLVLFPYIFVHLGTVLLNHIKQKQMLMNHELQVITKLHLTNNVYRFLSISLPTST